ncbi:MAG: CoA-acylating methylmalonate-semialdehyde dehydrogenase [Deltaproteobacteria bacterium]|nr:CoA-acylating methylmalonate-semialdehyde dehydrogenase [Deltaproteobacteria bacterium]
MTTETRIQKNDYLPGFNGRSYEFCNYVDAKNWIGGEWRHAIPMSGEPSTIPVYNPRHGKVMGNVSLSSPADIDAAVAAAKAAYAGWRATPIKERVQVLYRLKALMERDAEEVAWLLSHENGKVYEQAVGSLNKGIECVEMGCALANMATGQYLEVSRGITCRSIFEPIGVCAGIVPFNFSMMVPLWMLPQALVAGNTFVLKPSEQVPYGTMKLAMLLHEAGLPPGVFNIVNGMAPVVEAICDHPDIKAVGFVGSTKVANLVYKRSTKAGKRALCLGGAKNHMIVVPDADPSLTAETLVAGAFGNSGQRCMAATVMVAVGDVQHIIDLLAEQTRVFKVGRDHGAIINPQSVERIRSYIDEAERMGATVLVDGRKAKVQGCRDGFWIGATLLDGVTKEMTAYREEIFGPVFSIVHVDTLDEALELENSHPYGNGAGIFTTNGGIARYVVDRLEAGMCGVNIGVPVPREPFSFAGWNMSKFGHGDMTGEDGFRFWTRPKKVTTRWSMAEDATWMS